MAKPKLDFKKLLLERGEQLGLSVAGIITLLLLLVSLLWPGKGLFSGSPEEKAKGLIDPATYIDAKLRDPNNLPGDSDKPDKNSNEKLIAYNMETVDAEKYRMASLIPSVGTGNQGRRPPHVMKIDEAVVKLARMQLQTNMMDDKGNIYVLVGEKGSAKDARSDRSNRFLRGGKGSMGGPKGPGMGGPGMGMGMGMGKGRMGGRGRFAPPGMGGDSGEEKTTKKLVAIPLASLAKRNDAVLAEQVLPLRMAVIAASFPYKAQIEEFRSKLALRSSNEVLAEMGAVKLKDKSEILPAFHFTGVEVQRRELDGDGKPIDNWKSLDLLQDYTPYVILSGARFEDEDPDVKSISFHGLVMPRLRGFRPEATAKGDGMGGPGVPGAPGVPPMAPGGPMRPRGPVGKGPAEGDAKSEGEKHKELYPPVERELGNLRKTLESLKGKSAEVAAPPDRFRGITDVFNPTAPPEPKAADADDKPMTGTDMKADPDAVREVPEHCLVRVIDTTIQPGKTYEYRLRVKMLNPNRGRTDVASPKYRDGDELPSEWSTMAIRVAVEPELRYYAVDQKKTGDLDPKKGGKYDGPNANVGLKEGEVWLQAHRWVEKVNIRSSEYEVGEWTVAERFPVTRGEYVGQKVRVQLPVWNITHEEFRLADDFSKKTKGASILVDFGYAASDPAQPEAIAIDFHRGKEVFEKVTKRNEEGAVAATAKVIDEAAPEVLIMDPSGRLRLLEGGRDAADPKREERRLQVRARIREVSQAAKKDGDGGNGKPFGN